MYLTVRDVLALPPLVELKVIAGDAGLDRRVARVSVLEVVGGAGRWTRGGELFMSTLTILPDDDRDAHIAVVRNLDRNHAAALCLHPGLTGHRFLDAMSEAADVCGLPLILIPEDMPYSVVTDAVMGGLLGRQAALLERSAAINRELTQAVLRGSELGEICQIVARRTRRPIAVFGPDGLEVMASSESAGRSGPSLAELLTHRAPCDPTAWQTTTQIVSGFDVGSPHQMLTTTIETEGGPVVQVAAPVMIRDAISAYLVTWEFSGALSELDYTVLAHACTAVGLEVLKQRAIIEATQRVRQDFYGAALNGEFGTLAEAANRARQAGVNLAPAYIVAALAWGGQLPVAAADELGRRPGSATVLHGGTLVVVLQVPDTQHDPLDAAARAIARVSAIASPPARPIAVGLSRIADGVLNLPAALLEARQAMAVAERLAPDGCPLRYDRLGVFRLLASVSDSALLQRYTQESLGRLLQARQGGDLALALEAYLDARGSYQVAAAALELHPNTVKYRLAKVRSLLGDRELDDPTLRLGLHLALKVRHLAP